MPVISHGQEIVFGGSDRKPLKGFPPGKVRMRLRGEEFARAFVRNETGTYSFYIVEKDGFWVPGLLEAANLTETYAGCRNPCPPISIPRKRLHLSGHLVESPRIEAADLSGGKG